MQDVFTRVWTTQSFTPEKGRFENWIAVVARRVVIGYLRKSGRTLDTPDSDRLESTGSVNPLDDQLQHRWLQQDLVGSMENLHENDRVVLELAYFKGHTLSEIARLLNIPLGTVKTRLHRALKTMKKSMTDWSAEA